MVLARGAELAGAAWLLRIDDNAIADARGGYPFADCFNDAATLMPGNERWVPEEVRAVQRGQIRSAHAG